MRWFRGMAMVLVGIMLLTISGSAFAAVKDDTVSPLYLYTRKVKACLSMRTVLYCTRPCYIYLDRIAATAWLSL